MCRRDRSVTFRAIKTFIVFADRVDLPYQPNVRSDVRMVDVRMIQRDPGIVINPRTTIGERVQLGHGSGSGRRTANSD